MVLVLYGLTAVGCLLACVMGVLLYVRMTGSGEKFRQVLAFKFREMDEKTGGPPQTSPAKCPQCDKAAGSGRFCQNCGSPLF